MPSPRILALAAALSVLSGCDAMPDGQADQGPPPLEGAALGAPFTLTGEDGKPVRWDDFAGQYRIVYFGYTFCPDVCPTTLQRAAQGWQMFGKAHPDADKRVAALFISVDPERDTPAVLREFTDAFDPRIIGLTGTPDQLAATAKAFGAYAQKGDVAPSGGYLFEHLDVVYLFGPKGEPLAMLPADQGPEAVAAELAKWVR